MNYFTIYYIIPGFEKQQWIISIVINIEPNATAAIQYFQPFVPCFS